MSVGNCLVAFAIAACTSCAAPSICRFKSNCSVIFVLPKELVEFIELSPAMLENCFSNGVATEVAIVSGLAPGRVADT